MYRNQKQDTPKISRGKILKLSDDECLYLKYLFNEYSFEIENDVIHCEAGAESLSKKVEEL